MLRGTGSSEDHLKCSYGSVEELAQQHGTTMLESMGEHHHEDDYCCNAVDSFNICLSEKAHSLSEAVLDVESPIIPKVVPSSGPISPSGPASESSAVVTPAGLGVSGIGGGHGGDEDGQGGIIVTDGSNNYDLLLTWKPNRGGMRIAMLWLVIASIMAGVLIGVQSTYVLYMVGYYNEEYSMGLGDVEALQVVASSSILVATMPFVGAILVDGFLYAYESIFVFSIIYTAGFTLLALSAFPSVFNGNFPHWAVYTAVYFLLPVGRGILFAALSIIPPMQLDGPATPESVMRRFWLRSGLIEAFSKLIFSGTFAKLASENVADAYLTATGCSLLVPLGAMILGPFTIRPEPGKRRTYFAMKAVVTKTCCNNSEPSADEKEVLSDMKYLVRGVFPFVICMIPLQIYNDGRVTIPQAKVMDSCGTIIDAAFLNTFLELFKVIVAMTLDMIIFPKLEARGYKARPFHIILVGTFMGILSLSSSLLIDITIRVRFHEDGSTVPIFWQVVPLFLMASFDMLVGPVSKQVAFKHSPFYLKAIALALMTNLPHVIAHAVDTLTLSAFKHVAFEAANGSTRLSSLELYVSAHTYMYWGYLLFLSILSSFLVLMFHFCGVLKMRPYQGNQLHE